MKMKTMESMPMDWFAESGGGRRTERRIQQKG
jgi:hypothetical protein